VVHLAELDVCVTVHFKIVRIYAKSVPRVHGHKRMLRRRRQWLIAAPKIDWSNCAHSSIRRVLSSSKQCLLFCCLVCYFLRRIFTTTQLLNYVASSVELMMPM